MKKTTALVLIDVQRGLIEGFEDDWAGVLERIAQLVDRARQSQTPVVYVQHDGGSGHPLEVGSAGWQIHTTVAPATGDPIIHKRWSDAFVGTTLEHELASRDVGHLVITGAQTEYCVDATVRRAASLGYDVTLVADGHTTSANGVLSRQQIIAHHNRTLPRLARVGPRIVATSAADVSLATAALQPAVTPRS
jgi:nicotinamidase-related amidase